MKTLANIYHNISHPASYSNARNLARAVRDRRVAKKKFYHGSRVETRIACIVLYVIDIPVVCTA